MRVTVRDPNDKSNSQSKVVRNKNITESMSSTSSTVQNREIVPMIDIKVARDYWMGLLTKPHLS